MSQKQQQGKQLVENNEPTGPGHSLRLAREALGFTQEEIARLLRLTGENIDKIERDDYSSGLAFIFLRGYLRAYAKQVGLSPDAIVAEFDKLELTDQRLNPVWVGSLSPKNDPERKLKRWLLYGVVLGVALTVTWWWQNHVLHDDQPVTLVEKLAEAVEIE